MTGPSNEQVEAMDAALTDILGLHGPWVLACETYADDGEQQLTTMWPGSSTKWHQLGLARAMVIDLEEPFRQIAQEDQ